MKLGIKVGLNGDSFSDLRKTQPDFCEVWFNINQKDDYKNLFKQISSLNIGCGLHFWGATRNHYLANFAYPDNRILSESMELVKQTIDIANLNHFDYVNIHPGAALLSSVDFSKYPVEFKPVSGVVELDVASQTLNKSLSVLSKYARSKQVTLYVESVPKNAYSPGPGGKLDRLNYKYLAEIPMSVTESILPMDNLYFTNDFGHTVANLVSDNRQRLLDYLFTTSAKMAKLTRLLHVGYIIPPYNGTDYHGSLTYDEIMTDDALPNFKELGQLIKIFKDQDVWALAEPEKDHVGNFFALKKLVGQSLKQP